MDEEVDIVSFVFVDCVKVDDFFGLIFLLVDMLYLGCFEILNFMDDFFELLDEDIFFFF